MPNGDKTGPAGAGPMTGRAAGLCMGNTRLVNSNGFCRGAKPRSGFGGGFGQRGFGRNIALSRMTELNNEEESQILKNQAEYLKQNLERVNERISMLNEQQNQT